MTRRSLLLLALLSLSCRAKGSGSASRVRCPHCGMLVDERSPFRAELRDDSGTRVFDTPRCALAARLAKAPLAKMPELHVREHYSQASLRGEEVVFVAGSDVEGPMGPELVPVHPDKVQKFMGDHRGRRTYKLGDVTQAILKDEGAP